MQYYWHFTSFNPFIPPGQYLILFTTWNADFYCSLYRDMKHQAGTGDAWLYEKGWAMYPVSNINFQFLGKYP